MPEHVLLASRLVEIADALDAKEATEEAIRQNLDKSDPEKHLVWLKRQIKTAENRLREQGVTA